jgi:hypothetical protein
MTVMKFALLGTAALAAVSVSARADDLADMKAQIEALNGRIAQLESTPTIPGGYQLLTVSEANAIIVPGIDAAADRFYGDKATNIGVTPTADVPDMPPAAGPNFQWSGFVRAGVVYRAARGTIHDWNPVTGAETANETFDGESIDVVSRAGLKVVGTTDTAVGEVGVRITLLATAEALGIDGPNRSHVSFADDGYWGWWKITPELTLAGGIAGSLADSSNAFDNRCTCAYIQTGGGFGHEDPTQIRLGYESGPISFAIAVEDEGNTTTKSALGVAGEVKYSGDSLGFDLNAGYWDSKSSDLNDGDAAWTVNAGANLALGDMAKLGVAVGVGEDQHITGSYDQYAKGSAFLGFTVSDTVSAELGATYTDYKGNAYVATFAGGLYYTPVEQLTLGMEASYLKDKNNPDFWHSATSLHRVSGKQARADMIAIWRF